MQDKATDSAQNATLKDAVCAGEVMLEMAPEGSGTYRRGFAGDSFNTAVYLARTGVPTRYLTRLGDDQGSTDIIAMMQEEGLDSSLVTRVPGRHAGLYLIDNDASGERYFTYYREHSPARQTFSETLQFQTDLFYFTGITLAICREDLDRLTQLLEQLADQGTRIVFDPNYRPLLWPDIDQAREHYRQVLPLCHTLLPTLADDSILWSLQSIRESLEFYRSLGASEIVIKGDELTSLGWTEHEQVERRASAVPALDTTGAGDAFNAGYLGARTRGASLGSAIDAAQQLAATVVQHPGAIIPRNDTTQGNH